MKGETGSEWAEYKTKVWTWTAIEKNARKWGKTKSRPHAAMFGDAHCSVIMTGVYIIE